MISFTHSSYLQLLGIIISFLLITLCSSTSNNTNPKNNYNCHEIHGIYHKLDDNRFITYTHTNKDKLLLEYEYNGNSFGQPTSEASITKNCTGIVTYGPSSHQYSIVYEPKKREVIYETTTAFSRTYFYLSHCNDLVARFRDPSQNFVSGNKNVGEMIIYSFEDDQNNNSNNNNNNNNSNTNISHFYINFPVINNMHEARGWVDSNCNGNVTFFGRKQKFPHESPHPEVKSFQYQEGKLVWNGNSSDFWIDTKE
eukprot:Pgem_evm1s7283